MVQLNQENNQLKDIVNDLKNKNQEQQFIINDLEMKLNSLKNKCEELKSERKYNENDNNILLKKEEYTKPYISNSASSSSYTSSSNQIQAMSNYDNDIATIKNQCINYSYIYFIYLVNEVLNGYREMKYQFSLFQQQHQQQQQQPRQQPYIPSNAENFINKTAIPERSFGYDNDYGKESDGNYSIDNDDDEEEDDDDVLSYVNTELYDDNSDNHHLYKTPIKSRENNSHKHHHKHNHIHRYNITKEKEKQHKISIYFFIFFIEIIHLEHPIPSMKDLSNDLDDNPYILPYELRMNQFSSPIKPQFYSNRISINTLDMQYERVKNLIQKYDKICNLKKN